MRQVVVALAVVLALVAGAARAQDRVWVQIEAQPNREEGLERAQAYSAVFADAAGFRLNSGWYAIALGPYDRATAAARLAELKRENMIPRDSYISDGRSYLEAFWPPEGQAPEPEPEPAPESAPEPLPREDALAATAPSLPDLVTAPEPQQEAAAPEPVASEPIASEAVSPEPVAPPAPALPDETPEEARQSEGLLTAEDREQLQVAMQWFGFYSGPIDGAFGRGTRASMAAWQEARGHEPTGILTTAQRAELLAAWQGERAEYGFETVTETEAGIEITLPLGLVAFDHYEPPFVHYSETGGSGVRVILISEPGDQAALQGLYDILQTLAVVPPDGPREKSAQGFTIEGRSATLASFSRAELNRGLIKGYIVVWNPADDARMRRVLEVMSASFRPVGDRALDPGMVALSDGVRSGLMAGLEVRRPRLSRSGFYIDGQGLVLTTTEAVEGCARVTVEGDHAVTTLLADADLGLAVLAPTKPVSPPAIAGFQQAPDRIGSEIAVAGFPYEDRVTSPVVTFGALAASAGLDGRADRKQLALTMRAGDAGGPVLDQTGSVLGMLLAPPQGSDQVLPADLAFAVTGQAIAAALASAGIETLAESRQIALPPDDLIARARGMTVLVSCWD